MDRVIIGIDLGGTNLRIGAVTPKNEIKAPSVLKSSIIANAQKPVEKLCEIITEYQKNNGIKEIDAISIGVPSSVANDKETVICTTNIRDNTGKIVFLNRNIAREMKEYFHIPVFVNNDVNNILSYDIAVNQLEKQKIVIGIYIGTGVGASAVIDGRPLEGKDGAEFDLGHIPYYKGDALCSCGKRGCCECYASGWRLQEIRKQYFPDTKIGDLFIYHKDKEPMKEFLDACAHIFAVMATIFNPSTLIAGGGVLEMKDFPRMEFEQAVYNKTGRDVTSYGFDFVYSEDFMGKGIIGAAIFARSKMKQSF